MARLGNYGWSPRQMERVNARRREQGKEELVNVNNPPQYSDYEEERPMSKSDYIRQQYRNALQERRAAEKELSGMSGAERQSKRMSSFSERFKPSMRQAAQARTSAFEKSRPAPYSKAIEANIGAQAKKIKKDEDEDKFNSIASAFSRLS